MKSSDKKNPLFPKTLPNPLPDVLPFNQEMLPASIRDYIYDIADRQQSPVDFVAIPALCALSAVLGRKVMIAPKQLDDWVLTANLWGVIIGRPSTMKSPSMKEALKPLYQIEERAFEQYDSDLIQYYAEKELVDLEKITHKSQAKQMLQEGNRDGALERLKENIVNQKPPIKLRIVVNDTSPEKLGELLSQNPNGLLLVRDEFSGFITKLSAEENQGERAFYLECFDGNGRYTTDRIIRGTIEIKNCILSMIGGIQPSRIGPLVRQAISGAADDGLVQRLQLSVWPDDSKKWKWNDKAPNATARASYYNVFETLHAKQFNSDNETPLILHFSQKAQKLFIQWMENNQKLAHGDSITPALESYLLKLPKTIASLALLFEVIAGGEETVNEEAIIMSVKWAPYLMSHAERLYSQVHNQGLIGAHLILKRKEKLKSPFNARTVQRKCWASLDTIDIIVQALEYLIEYEYLRSEVIPTTHAGGRPTVLYHWKI